MVIVELGRVSSDDSAGGSPRDVLLDGLKRDGQHCVGLWPPLSFKDGDRGLEECAVPDDHRFFHKVVHEGIGKVAGCHLCVFGEKLLGLLIPFDRVYPVEEIQNRLGCWVGLAMNHAPVNGPLLTCLVRLTSLLRRRRYLLLALSNQRISPRPEMLRCVRGDSLGATDAVFFIEVDCAVRQLHPIALRWLREVATEAAPSDWESGHSLRYPYPKRTACVADVLAPSVRQEKEFEVLLADRYSVFVLAADVVHV